MLGRHLLALLAEDKIESLPATRSSWDLADTKTPEELDRLFPDARALIHAGALVPVGPDASSRQALLDVNVRATLCLGVWAKARNIPLVFISSSTVYADPGKRGIRESDDKAEAPGLGGFYGRSKLEAERALQQLGGPRLCILRPSSVYGTGLKPNNLVAKFLAAAGRGETIRLTPPVDDEVNLLHASDLARAALDALRRDAAGVFNVAAAAGTSIAELARACVAAAGKGEVAAPSGASGLGSARFMLDCSAARDAFGFQPRVALRDGLARMAAGRC